LIHGSTGVSLIQMQNNKNLEGQYIFDSIQRQIKIENIAPSYKLNINDKVRFIEIEKHWKKQD
jgi:hypothetical protein